MMGGSAFPNFNPALHSLRGLAACAVMLFHWEQFFPAFGALVQSLVPANSLLDPTAYIGFGWMGVPLFFILSGWLLGGQVIRADITAGYLRHFWTRRFLRIYPAVWAELLVLLLLARSIPGLIDAASYNTLHLQFLLWLNHATRRGYRDFTLQTCANLTPSEKVSSVTMMAVSRPDDSE